VNYQLLRLAFLVFFLPRAASAGWLSEQRANFNLTVHNRMDEKCKEEIKKGKAEIAESNRKTEAGTCGDCTTQSSSLNKAVANVLAPLEKLVPSADTIEQKFFSEFSEYQLTESKCENDMLNELDLVSIVDGKGNREPKPITPSEWIAWNKKHPDAPCSDKVQKKGSSGPYTEFSYNAIKAGACTYDLSTRGLKGMEIKINKKAVAKQEKVLWTVWSRLKEYTAVRKICAKSQASSAIFKSAKIEMEEIQKDKAVDQNLKNSLQNSVDRSYLSSTTTRDLSCPAQLAIMKQMWSGDDPAMKAFVDHWSDQLEKTPSLDWGNFVKQTIPVERGNASNNFKWDDIRGLKDNNDVKWSGTFQKMVLDKLSSATQKRIRSLEALKNDGLRNRYAPFGSSSVTNDQAVEREAKKALYADDGLAAEKFMKERCLLKSLSNQSREKCERESKLMTDLSCRMNGRYGAGDRRIDTYIEYSIGAVAAGSTALATGGLSIGASYGVVAAAAGVGIAANTALLAMSLEKAYAACLGSPIGKPGSLIGEPLCRQMQNAKNEVEKINLLTANIDGDTCEGRALESVLAIAGLGLDGLQAMNLLSKEGKTAYNIELFLKKLSNDPSQATRLSTLFRQKGVPMDEFLMAVNKQDPELAKRILQMGEKELDDVASRLRMCVRAK
jgi:hypothetical protein